jgi:putative phosphoribosyl transferase
MILFNDRVEAGKKLASELIDLAGTNSLVLAIPRGGAVVGYEVAHALRVPLDVIIPRKIGAPHNSELAIGAVTEDGTIILDDKLVHYLEVPETYIEQESEKQCLEINRRLKLYRGDAPYPNLKNRNAILVDDGIATGSTIRAALASVRKKGAKTIVIAVPVAPPSALKILRKEADRVVCLHTPEQFDAIGEFYRVFNQTSDEEVIRLLKLSRKELASQDV